MILDPLLLLLTADSMHGNTALHLAASSGSVAEVERLLAAGTWWKQPPQHLVGGNTAEPHNTSTAAHACAHAWCVCMCVCTFVFVVPMRLGGAGEGSTVSGQVFVCVRKFLGLPRHLRVDDASCPTGERPDAENDFGIYPEEVASNPEVLAVLKAARYGWTGLCAAWRFLGRPPA
jgi:hypothetical protein